MYRKKKIKIIKYDVILKQFVIMKRHHLLRKLSCIVKTHCIQEMIHDYFWFFLNWMLSLTFRIPPPHTFFISLIFLHVKILKYYSCSIPLESCLEKTTFLYAFLTKLQTFIRSWVDVRFLFYFHFNVVNIYWYMYNHYCLFFLS